VCVGVRIREECHYRCLRESFGGYDETTRKYERAILGDYNVNGLKTYLSVYVRRVYSHSTHSPLVIFPVPLT
jgi:hypothetical protein